MGWRRIVVAPVLTAVASFASLAPRAFATATLTYPADGQTVTLDKKLTFDFRWTLPPGEVYPQVYVGVQPRYDVQNQLDPFNSWCGGQDALATSCRLQNDSGIIPVAGTHYAVVATASNSPQGPDTPFVSPEIRFSVPFRIGLGCVPTAGCEWPRLSNDWLPFGDADYGHPHTKFDIWAWTNGPRLTLGYTLRRGRRVLKHWQRTAGANVIFDTPEPDLLELTIFHLPGIPAGTPLRCTVKFTSGNAVFTRTYTVRAGAGPTRGVRSLVQ